VPPTPPMFLRRCGFCQEPKVRAAEATEIAAHGVPLGVEQRWTCESCGQSFATLTPLLYLLFFVGCVGFAGGALFGAVSGGEDARLVARLLLLGLALWLGVVGATRLRADRRSPRL
jgi:hypothetical protein